MSNSCFTDDSHGARAQAIVLQERDIKWHWAIVQQVSRGLPVGAARARLPAFTSESASSFQFGLRHHFRTPRPGRCTLERLFVSCPKGTRFLTLRFASGCAISALSRFVTSDANERRRLTVSVVLRRLRLFRFAGPSTQPQRGFPPPPARGLPPRALSRPPSPRLMGASASGAGARAPAFRSRQELLGTCTTRTLPRSPATSCRSPGP